MKEVKVTPMEKEFIDALIVRLYAEPDFSDVDLENIKDEQMNKYSLKVLKGVLGSLIKKKLVYICENGDEPKMYIHLEYCLWHMHPEWYLAEDAPTEEIELVTD